MKKQKVIKMLETIRRDIEEVPEYEPEFTEDDIKKIDEMLTTVFHDIGRVINMIQRLDAE